MKTREEAREEYKKLIVFNAIEISPHGVLKIEEFIHSLRTADRLALVEKVREWAETAKNGYKETQYRYASEVLDDLSSFTETLLRDDK